MPRSFTEAERSKLLDRIKSAAKELLTVYGARKTTIEMIVKKAVIPKGTFYLFYASKELLLWDVINDYHKTISKVLKDAVENTKDIDAQRFSEILFEIFITVSKSFYPALMIEGEMEAIIRKLPDDLVKDHHNDDADMLTELASILPADSPVFSNRKKVEAVSGALRILFFSLLHRREIGETLYDQSLKILLNGVALELFEPAYKGSEI
ncbi:MAG TPA: TetR/AcrR family transcriptional regulator [Treponemataceae bacterium]|nr:TetR/AcrR family transcriptional regulator [Treponemataceae bacterium]